MRSKKVRSMRMAVFAIFAAFSPLLTVPTQSQAQTFKVLHTFHGSDGAYPVGVLVRDAEGNLYGTTGAGGSGNCSGGDGCGTAFKLDKAGKQVWLHKFDGANGSGPNAGLLRDAAGTLFGTTIEGGDIECNYAYGCGTVFMLDKTGKEKVVHKFTGPPDGSYSEALLTRDGTGNLYGTTYSGGTGGFGTMFKVDSAGKKRVLYNFTGYSDGGTPEPGVILDAAGNAYGVAVYGGSGFNSSGYGVVFEVDTSGNESVLHAFGGGEDGANPASVLIFDPQGNLYGTTLNGGTGCGGAGCGVVFKLTQSGGSWSESVLYDFCSLSDCADGQEPWGGPLVRDQTGNLYGTTFFGGASHNCDGGGCGTVFELDAAGKETVLHSFAGGADGAFPHAGLIMDGQGNLYGTTINGGATCYTRYTCGVVFKIAP
jgi:uncharacterized repeat protein (TIGR03803 family)